MDEKPRLLLVEDEAHLREGLSLNFELEGFRVCAAASLAEARQAICDFIPELIVLDLMLPDGSGLDLCRELRRDNNLSPIICLTAAGRPGDVVEGLESGADDYLTKPFELRELMVRVRVLQRRRRWDDERTIRQISAIGVADVDWEAHKFVRDGVVRQLTGLEMKLLTHFVQNAGRTLSRDDLLEEVWGLTGYQTRTVDNFVARMRKYFERDPACPEHFVTVRGAGYRFEH